MPKLVEVDEEQLLRDQKLRQQVTALRANPKAWEHVERAMKVVDPNVPTPTLDQSKVVNEPYEALAKKFDTFVDETKKEREEREKNEKLSVLKGTYESGLKELRRQGYTDEGIQAIEALCDSKGILDPLDAAAIYEKNNPPPAPITPGGHGARWDFMHVPDEGPSDIKKLIETQGNNELVVDKMAFDALSEFRGNQQSRR